MKAVDREVLIRAEKETRGTNKFMRLLSLVMISCMANKYFES